MDPDRSSLSSHPGEEPPPFCSPGRIPSVIREADDRQRRVSRQAKLGGTTGIESLPSQSGREACLQEAGMLDKLNEIERSGLEAL